MDSLKPLIHKDFYRFGEFKVEIKERRLWYGEERVSLTPKEFDVLFFLIERRGSLVEKTELLDAIWADTFIEEATLARNISWLRKKLKKYSNGEKFIETVPRRGYCFIAEVSHENTQDQIVVEEQKIQYIEAEETFTFNDAEFQNSNNGFGKTDSSESIKGFSVSHYFQSTKILFLILGSIASLGISYFAYQNYFTKNTRSSFTKNTIVNSPRLVNLALGKPTKQSSNSEKNRGLSYEAVDGNTNGNWFQASVSNTGDDRMDSIKVRGTIDPWWEVDLGKVYGIQEIRIYNRTDLNSHYLSNFKVEIRNDTNEKFKPFVDGLRNYEDRRTNPIILQNRVNARYVRIQVIGSSKFLSLAEVEVLGIPKSEEVTKIPESCQPKETQITVFPEQYYQGKCLVLDLRNYPNFESLGDKNNKFYSLLVGEDIKAKVCTKLNFQGKCEEIISRRSFEELILSIKMADFFQLKNVENKCLEVDLEMNQTIVPLKMTQCADNKNQQWFWTEWGQLRTNGNRCLDLSNNDRVVVTPCKKKSLSNDRLQRWVWTNLDEIRTATRNKTCLTFNKSATENDDSIIIKECDFGESQTWKFVK